MHELLTNEGLGRYYALGGGKGSAVTTWGRRKDHKWLERLTADLECEDQRAGAPSGVTHVALSVQGVHCAACVWLFEELFRRQGKGAALTVNPALGRMDLSVDRGFDVSRFVSQVERFGYLVGPIDEAARSEVHETSDLLMRTGVTVAIAMNAMIFAIAIYAGLESGPIFRFFHGLNFALATLSVLVGGTVFFRSAWQALRARVLHLDVPIALGIVFAYTGSALSLFLGGGKAAYFDTVSVFIALMLVGRFLQERVLVRNRRELLTGDVDALLTRMIAPDGGVRLVPCSEVDAGARLLVAPSDLVPVPAALEEESASVSLDWINGESSPRAVRRGERIDAGAFNVGQSAIVVRALSPFAASPILSLLRSPRAGVRDAARATPWWRLFTRVYVIVVLGVAAVTFAAWLYATRDLTRALEVTTALLVVTCPCAFGIATPMAYEFVQAGLRRAGVFVRSASFLDRAVDVRRVVFDKTGTLTTGDLAVADVTSLAALEPVDLRALYDLAARSAHPKSVALSKALERHLGKVSLRADLVVTEHAGAGVELVFGHTYRLGSREFVGADSVGDVFFSRDGRVLAAFEFAESLRPDARGEIGALEAAGYDVWILSGDAQSRVDELAQRVDVPLERAIGERSPEGKAAWLEDHERSFMIGDGLNDGLAAERAFASATPAIDRPFMPAKTDLYFTTAGLRPVRLALTAAAALRRVTRRNLLIAVLYNVLTVLLASLGLMTPLLCAVVMPLSSLSIVLLTVASLSPRSPLWKC